MAQNAEEVIAAQVVLRTASGKVPDTNVTAETLQQNLPAPEVAAQVRANYSAAGFEVGPLVANSFSITATRANFERGFGVKLRKTARGGMQWVLPDGSASSELPLAEVDKSLSQHVAAVTFPAPPDFGPGQFS